VGHPRAGTKLHPETRKYWARLRLQGKQHTTTRKRFSPRNLPRSLPTDPHSPHACSTPGVYTFSVTWTVLRLLISLALGYRNRSDRKSPSSVAATGFLPGVLSFLRALSHLERIAHRPTTYSSNLNHLSHLERVLHHWPTRPHAVSTAWSQQLTGKTDTGFPTGSTMVGHFYFPIRQHRIDSRSGCRGCVTNNPCRVNTGSNCSDRGGTGYLRSQPRLFGFQGCTRVFFCRGPIVYLQTVR
jgi:hypothetical protein